VSNKVDPLTQIIGAKAEAAAQSAQWVSIASQHKLNEEMIHNARRQNAQVDAYLKAKFEACGQPDAYQPPEPGESEVPTLINCSINGDKAVTNILKAISEDGDKIEPDKPTGGNKWLKWLLGTLLAVTLGALLVMISWQLFGDASRYEIIAIDPYNPPA